MGCLSCDGSGCDDCENTGTITITNCPLELITSDIWEIIEYAELYEKGLPPIAGGALDQAQCFLDAARFIFAIRGYVKKKLGIIG